VKLKMLAVLTLVVFGCAFASAQTFGFGTAGGDYLYCNYEQISNAYGDPYTVWQGVDNLSACYYGSHALAPMVGVKGGLPKAHSPIGIGVSGVVMADALIDAYSLVYTGEQWDTVSALKCTDLGAKRPKEGWIGLVGVSGLGFVGNYGTLSCTVYAKGQAKPNKGVSFGKTNHLKKH